MKGPRELKRLIALMRKRYHKGNGVIPGSAFDSPRILKLAQGKKARRTCHRIERPEFFR